MNCPRCRNTGKVSRPGVQVCPVDLGSWGYCKCYIGQAVYYIEVAANRIDMANAVRRAIRAGADIRHVQIPRYPGHPKVNAELDEIEATFKFVTAPLLSPAKK